MIDTNDVKRRAIDAWVAFQHSAETMKQSILAAAGETRDTVSAATKKAIDNIDAAVQTVKDHLPK